MIRLHRKGVTVDGVFIVLPRYQLLVVEYLLIWRGRRCEATDILEYMYGDREDGGPEWARSGLGVNIFRLRKKLGAGFIETQQGNGYRIPG